MYSHHDAKGGAEAQQHQELRRQELELGLWLLVYTQVLGC